MSEETLRAIFATNLNRLMKKNGIKQVDIIERFKVSSSTVSDWCNGNKMPRLDKIEALATMLGVEKSDLLEEKDESHYYINDDAREMAEFLYKNPDYKVLFDASRKVKKEDIAFVKTMLDRFKGDE